MLVGYCGRPERGNDLLRPLRARFKAQVDTIKTLSYLEAQRSWFPAAAAKPSGYFVANLFLPTLSHAAIAAITAATQDAPRRFMVLIVNFRGAVTRVPETDMAFAMRQPGYEVDVFGHWSAPEEKDTAVRWVFALRDKLQPFSHGLYINGLSETNNELRQAGLRGKLCAPGGDQEKVRPGESAASQPEHKTG